MVDSARLLFLVNTESQKESLKEINNQLENFLKKDLNNKHLVINIEVSEAKQDKKKLYTDSDKLQYLKDQNPNVSALQKQFNLDFGKV
ncbi:MAG: hypothetical protein C0594_13080 [Marinilabiliales bacterium]|nr:MAG: hypothetical protein C0594_13080 [Marinilabiliales bacterium]